MGRVTDSKFTKEYDNMDWLIVLIFGVIPVLTVGIIFLVKRTILWRAPLISTALAFITYMITLCITINPSAMLTTFTISEYRGFLLLDMLMVLGITVVLTVIAYFIEYLLERKQK